MSTRHAYSVIGAAVLSCAAVAWAQTSEPQTHDPQRHEQQTPGQTATATLEQADSEGTPITLVGCLQRESDSREQQDAGRGGFLSTGLGLRNEYILINASRAGSSGASSIDCSSAGSGEAYELTGSAEPDLEPFVGRMVEISGTMKRAALDDNDDRAVGTGGTTAAQPSGGFDPLGQDLRLYEIEVSSFREVTALAEATTQQQETQAIGTTGAAEPPARPEEPGPGLPSATGFEQQREQEERLPGTASPLPLAGLLGLLSLVSALGLRRMRR